MARRNPDRAAKILVDAAAMGDRKAAERWKVSERTVRNYRAALSTDEKLAATFTETAHEAERSWHLIRNRFLRDVTEHLRELCLKAEPGQIKDVREAIKDIGELDLAREALGVSSGDSQQGPTLPASPGGDAPEAEGHSAEADDPGAGAG